TSHNAGEAAQASYSPRMRPSGHRAECTKPVRQEVDMIRITLLATALAAAGAMAAPPAAKPTPAAQQTAPAATGISDWHNTVHPVPPGSDTPRDEPSGSTAAQASPAQDASSPPDDWHNTVHPIPPGGSKVRTSTRHPPARHRHRAVKPAASSG